MDEICKNCKYITMLKHNFTVGKGFEESFCCTIFANEEDGFVIEVELNDMCEMYQRQEDESNG